MDSPTRVSVASLVRQRGAGELSREVFFERLASLQLSNATGEAAGCEPSEACREESPGLASAPPRFGSQTTVNIYEDGGALLRAHGACASSSAPLTQLRPHDAWAATAEGKVIRDERLRQNEHFSKGAAGDVVSGARYTSTVGDTPRARKSASVPPSPPRTPRSARVLNVNDYSITPTQRSTCRDVDASHREFVQRNLRWDMQRSQRCEELRRRREEKEFAECSFQPAVGDDQSFACERENGPATLTSAQVAEITNRLAQPSVAPRISHEALEWQKNRENEELQHCTFHPNLSKSSRSFQPRKMPLSASQSTSDAVSDGPGQQASAEEYNSGVVARETDRNSHSPPSCFVPATNAVPSSMRNARAYLDDNVFTRLTRSQADSHRASSARRRRPGSLSGTDASRSDISPASNALGRCRSEVVVGGDRVHAKVTSFLQRQSECQEIRRARLDDLDRAGSSAHQPALCERSLRLVERQRARGGDETQKPMQGDAGAGKRALEDPNARECTFRPKITHAAAKRDPRSNEQRSLGDQKRREAKLEKLRVEKEKREQKEESYVHEFKDYNGVKSRLRILEAPETYLQRMEKVRRNAVERVEKQNQDRTREVELECTFKPTVRPAPDYVRRMAESYRMVRSEKEKENLSVSGSDSVKPEWR